MFSSPIPFSIQKGLEKLNFPFATFFTDLYFFFKLSSAIREDYKDISEVTGIMAEFVKRIVCCLEQWENLEYYFLTLLPKQDDFRSSLEKTGRCKKIKEHFKNIITKAYLPFMTFVAQDFAVFLRKFQYEQTMIHVLYPGMVEMIRTVMTKFVRKKCLVTDQETLKLDEDLLMVNVLCEKICTPANQVEFGMFAKRLLGSNNILTDDICLKFQQECLKFYQRATTYFLEKLPIDSKLIKYAQYLHHEKRNIPGALNAISNLAISVTKAQI